MLTKLKKVPNLKYFTYNCDVYLKMDALGIDSNGDPYVLRLKNPEIVSLYSNFEVNQIYSEININFFNNMNNINNLLKEVSQMHHCSVDEIQWYSWPTNFPTTAGPGVCGGNMVTQFQVIAFRTPQSNIKYCNGVWKHWNGEFNGRW